MRHLACALLAASLFGCARDFSNDTIPEFASEPTISGIAPAQVTLASVEKIAKLVNEHLPGIPLQPLSVAPRQIPFHAGKTYFAVEPGAERPKVKA